MGFSARCGKVKTNPLPHEVGRCYFWDIPMIEECELTLQAIREDNTSGASELVHKAAQCVIFYSETTKIPSPSHFKRDLLDFMRRLISSQPAMAPFLNLANSVLMGVEQEEDVERIKEAMSEAAKAFLRGLREIPRRVAIHAARLLSGRGRILTHSCSSTVFEAIRFTSGSGGRLSVICTESRPALEGVRMAKKLAAEGVGVDLAIDSAAPCLLREVDLLLTGGDALSPLGLVNKMGSYGLAIAARTCGVPFYVLCGTDKILTEELAERLRIEPRDPAEVLPTPHPGVEVINQYFDITPIEFLSGVVTEEGDGYDYGLPRAAWTDCLE
jgi:translation initiation factor 2B subunit (eIF-2B alpha/beta/delta family)